MHEAHVNDGPVAHLCSRIFAPSRVPSCWVKIMWGDATFAVCLPFQVVLLLQATHQFTLFHEIEWQDGIVVLSCFHGSRHHSSTTKLRKNTHGSLENASQSRSIPQETSSIRNITWDNGRPWHRSRSFSFACETGPVELRSLQCVAEDVSTAILVFLHSIYNENLNSNRRLHYNSVQQYPNVCTDIDRMRLLHAVYSPKHSTERSWAVGWRSRFDDSLCIHIEIYVHCSLQNTKYSYSHEILDRRATWMIKDDGKHVSCSLCQRSYILKLERLFCLPERWNTYVEW